MKRYLITKNTEKQFHTIDFSWDDYSDPPIPKNPDDFFIHTKCVELYADKKEKFYMYYDYGNDIVILFHNNTMLWYDYTIYHNLGGNYGILKNEWKSILFRAEWKIKKYEQYVNAGLKLLDNEAFQECFSIHEITLIKDIDALLDYESIYINVHEDNYIEKELIQNEIDMEKNLCMADELIFNQENISSSFLT